MNKKAKILLVGSLILNVLLIGVLAGFLPQRFEASSRQQRLQNAIKALPEPVRTRFGEKMEQIGKDVEPIRNQIQAARTETIRILSTEPFDEAAYDREVNKINQLRVQIVQQMAAGVKEVAKALPSDQRGELAKVLTRPPRD